MKRKAGNSVVRASGPTASLQDVLRVLVVDLRIPPEELERSLWKDEEEEFKNRGLVYCPSPRSHPAPAGVHPASDSPVPDRLIG